MGVCVNFGDKKLTAVELKKKCRYHKRQGQTYDSPVFVPEGMCFDAFHVAYPYCLALLYDAEFDESCHREKEEGRVILRCPVGHMTMEVRRLQSLPKPLKLAKTAVEWVFENIFNYPLAVVDYKIRLRVLDVNGECSQKVGAEYWMNIRDLDKLCPASFHALYPFLRASDKDRMIEFIHCPDHEGILYGVEATQ